MTTAAPQEKGNPQKGLLHYVGLGIGGALVLFVVALAVILVGIPKIAGATPLTVLTGSMEPRYPPGTLIYVLPVKTADVRMGDVITYQIETGQPAVISHRVIAINSPANGKRTFILKGDNNSAADPDPVVPGQIQGRLWYAVPLVGWVNSALNGVNRAWYVDVIAGLLLAYALFMAVSGVRAAVKKRATRKHSTTELSGSLPSTQPQRSQPEADLSTR
jgi:signal peptidase